jgi:hypothetical protein
VSSQTQAVVWKSVEAIRGRVARFILLGERELKGSVAQGLVG